MRHPNLKILELANLFVADAPRKKNQKFSFTPLSEHFGSENLPWVRGLNVRPFTTRLPNIVIHYASGEMVDIKQGIFSLAPQA